MAPFRLALISMPWPLANRPSIQLGTLTSYLSLNETDLDIDCYHLYLPVANLLGLVDYNALAERTWVAESVYGYLLNPGKRPEISALFCKELPKAHRHLDLETVSLKVEDLHQRQHFSLPWSSYDLIGFSICLAQLTSSIYMIRHIRSLHPNCRIVVGGSNCAGELGRSLLVNMDQIDFVVSGEGEIPLLNLIRRLKRGDTAEMKESSGLMWRDSHGQIKGGGYKQLRDLGKLSVPDYSSYFRSLQQQTHLGNLVPSIPVEASRGCWWHRAKPGFWGRACRFCNLNLQWEGYRSKKPPQVANEIEELATKHASLKFFFVDNILDSNKIEGLFDSIYGLDRSFELFAELRASVSPQQLFRMRRAGVTQVQIGVEGLSSNLLRKLNKGTTAIQNMEVMKYCEELGIRHLSNLLLGFPTSDEDDVAETLANLSFVQPYQPLRPVRFWLGQNSPVDLSPERYGLRQIRNHPNYRLLLPDELSTSLCLMIKTYVGDRTRQHRLWRPVFRELKTWRKHYDSLRGQHYPAPLLGYRDGRDFLLIRRRRKGTQMETFRLRGSSRAIYLFCNARRSLAELREQFPRSSTDQLQAFITDMMEKRLMFQEGEQVLSLAVNEDAHRVFCQEGKH
jgi:ribosomal peptide maturation radical SAM protein 1